MNRSLRIIIAGTSFSPEYGGPARSVSKLAIELVKTGIDVGLWSADGSSSGEQFVPRDSGVNILNGTFLNALDQFGDCDLIHDNGLWLAHNHQISKIASRLAIPRVVSTRGMLEPWALNHKKWKKKMAWWLYQFKDLKRARLLHATSVAEASQLRSLGLDNQMVVIPNGVEIPELHKPKRERLKGYRTLLFLSRVQRKKGLLNLVDAWCEAKVDGWKIRIVGPEEDGHLKEVRDAAFKAGVLGDFSFDDALGDERKWEAFVEADVFVLPTFSENFGIVVAEALASGTPVITTRGAPWEELLTHDCGWWVDIGPRPLAVALREAMALTDEQRTEMGERGKDLVRSKYDWSEIGRKMKGSYEQLLETHLEVGSVR